MNPLKTGFIHLGAGKITCSSALPLTLSSQQAVPMSGHKIHFHVGGKKKKRKKPLVCICKSSEGLWVSIQRYNMKGQTFRRWRCPAYFQIWAALTCLMLDVKKNKKAPIITLHTQNTLAYFFDRHHFLGGGQSPFRYQVSYAWQLGRQHRVEKALHSTSPDATCSQPSHRPLSPATPRNRLSLAHSPGREGAQMEPGNLEARKADTCERGCLHTPLSNNCASIQQEPLSPLPERLSPLLRIH